MSKKIDNLGKCFIVLGYARLQFRGMPVAGCGCDFCEEARK
jgi:hypothetical protein